MKLVRSLACLAVTLWAGAGMAQEVKKNLALVIGNSDYPWAQAAPSAKDDAWLMADALRALDFEVFSYTNAPERFMKRGLLEFRDIVRQRGQDTVAFVFFAGQAVQVNGQNYLIPVDADPQNKNNIEFEGLNVGTVLAALQSAEAKASIVVIDASRTNPFAAVRGAKAGLAAMDAQSGGGKALIAFASAPGTVAADSPEGQHSLYTAALAKAIAAKGIKIEDVLYDVSRTVSGQTHGAQTPWEASALTGKLYLAGPVSSADCASSNPPVACLWRDKR